MSTRHSPIPMEDKTRTRNALRAALLMFVAAAAYDDLAFYLAVQVGAAQLYAHAFFMLLFCAAMLGSAILNLRGRVQLSIIVQLTCLWIAITVIPQLLMGLGLTMALISVALTTGVAWLTLSGRQTVRAILLGVAAASLTLMLDVVLPVNYRFPAPDIIQIGASVCAGALALVYGLLVLRQYPNHSIRTKLILAFVLVAVISIGAVTLVADRTIRTNLTQSVGANLKSLAKNKAGLIGSLISRDVSLLQAAALNMSMQNAALTANTRYSGDAATIHRQLMQSNEKWASSSAGDPLVATVLEAPIADELRQFSVSFPDNAELYVTDQYGAMVAATTRVPRYYHADEPWWQRAYNNGDGAVFIGVPAFNAALAQYGIEIGVPLRAQPNTPTIGVVHAIYRLRPLTDALVPSDVADVRGTALLFPSGQLLRGQGELTMMPADTMDAVRKLGTIDFGDIQYRGQQRFVSEAAVSVLDPVLSKSLPRLGWTLIVDQDPTDALRPVSDAAQAALITSIGALLLAGLLALLMTQLLAGPVTRLTKVATLVAEGNLNARARVESGDEIGALAHTFNDMTTRLQQTLEGLEQRVAERTRELGAANTNLQKNNQYLAALQETSLGLIGRLHPDELLQDIVTRAGQLVGTEHGYVYLVELGETDAPTEMVMKIGVGAYHEFVGSRAQSGIGLAGTVWSTGKPIAVDDYRTWPRRLHSAGRDILRAVVGVPLVSGPQVLGVLGLAYLEEGRAFDAEALDVLTRFAQLASIALDNARLYAAAQGELMERTRAEEQLKTSLKEKDVLLKEIHHRVKNNLQVISSLLNLQSVHVKDPYAQAIFKDSQARVKSMALIHERLYQSNDLARIDLREYIRNLVAYLFRMNAVDPDRIHSNIDVGDAALGIDTAIPCGLIVNELVSNSLKYAFPNNRAGDIWIQFSRDEGKYKFIVGDNGVGLGEEIDFRNTESLGLQLVNTLTEQLHGTIELRNKLGAEYRITFAG